MLVPKLVTTLRGYTRAQLFADLTAGVVVGIVALPLAIAFAIASGVTPDRGLYTAIIAGFLISALGGSRVQIGGPTGAFVIIVYGVIQQHGINGLLVATIMAGFILVALGVTGLGSAIKFVPHPVIIGFTSGIALIIFSTQINDLIGLGLEEVPAEFVDKWVAYALHIADASPEAMAVAALALTIIVLTPRYFTRVPGPFVALVVTTVMVQLLHFDVETVGSRYGEIASGLPRPALPHFDMATIASLVPAATAIALLAAIESLLSAVVADGMIGGRHRSNMELVAQGVANMITPLFGGIPATGAIARTATNVRNGGRTPVAGMTHALVLLLITLFFGGLASYIPFATLAAILVVVAYHMSEWRSFRAELTAPKSDVLVMLTTFGLTVAVDLVVAIEVGMVLASFLFMKRMAEVTNVQVVTREFRDDNEGDALQKGDLEKRAPRGVEIFEINGPFFFGAATMFKDEIEAVLGRPRVLIIRMRNVPAIDSTGIHALTQIVRRSRKEKTFVLLSDVHSQPMMALGRSELLDEIGEENIFGNIDDAIVAARYYLTPPDARPTEVQL
jgi:sulfate permease, SulP family